MRWTTRGDGRISEGVGLAIRDDGMDVVGVEGGPTSLGGTAGVTETTGAGEALPSAFVTGRGSTGEPTVGEDVGSGLGKRGGAVVSLAHDRTASAEMTRTAGKAAVRYEVRLT